MTELTDWQKMICGIVDALEKRIKVLEDKKPRYVPPTVYGPIKKRRKII